MLLGFPRHALLLIFGDAIVWNSNLRFGSLRSTISNCEVAICANRASLSPDPRDNCVVLSLTCCFVHAEQ